MSIILKKGDLVQCVKQNDPKEIDSIFLYVGEDIEIDINVDKRFEDFIMIYYKHQNKLILRKKHYLYNTDFKRRDNLRAEDKFFVVEKINT